MLEIHLKLNLCVISCCDMQMKVGKRGSETQLLFCNVVSYTARHISAVAKSHHSGFGGLEVKCWPLVPKFAGSNPAEAVGFFSTPSFRGEVKPSVPCRRFTACKRFLNATWKSDISGKIHWPFLAHIVPLLATRISGETTSGERWNV